MGAGQVKRPTNVTLIEIEAEAPTIDDISRNTGKILQARICGNLVAHSLVDIDQNMGYFGAKGS